MGICVVIDLVDEEGLHDWSLKMVKIQNKNKKALTTKNKGLLHKPK